MLTFLTYHYSKFNLNHDNLFPKVKYAGNVTITDNDYWRQYRICFPPFNWSKPNGLTKETEKLFWSQPENWRHFKDTNSSNHCGVVRIVVNGIVSNPFPHLTNQTHFKNAIFPPKKSSNTDYNQLIVLIGHWGYYFQHFFDNIGPQISMIRHILGEDTINYPVAVETSNLFPVVDTLWERLPFDRIIKTSQGSILSADQLIYIESCPMVHPVFFKDLREMLNIPENDVEYVIYCQRKKTTSYYNQRFILNEEAVHKMLKKMYGSKLITFDHKRYNLEQTIELFSKAKLIIGPHGGALYNQFYANTKTVVVEIMPVKSNGLYPDQSSFKEVPSFAHMSIWSNTQLIGQKFYRYYSVTDTSNFKINITDFRQFLRKVNKDIEDNENKLEEL